MNFKGTELAIKFLELYIDSFEKTHPEDYGTYDCYKRWSRELNRRAGMTGVGPDMAGASEL